MDITKVNSDSDKLNLVNCNIVSVLEEIVMSTVLYASEKKRNIIFDTDSEEIILACDEDKIERIMLNLISNAIKFSQLHTDIEIKIKRNVDLNRVYMEEGKLLVIFLGRGMAWLDTGTHASMLQASNFVEAVQNTQGTYIACLEEISYRKGWITSEEVKELAKPLMKTGYGKYLVDIVEELEAKKK